ncbi:MAG: HupE/UreJ family protein [Roseovarius sp.]
MNPRAAITLTATLSATLAASPALAHVPAGSQGSFWAGIAHPLLGLDHVLAMVAVGLWAVQIGGRAVIRLPAAFVLAMTAGLALALAGVPLPLVEPMILASGIALGAVVALALRPDPRLAMAVVAAAAIFHGHAHGTGAGAMDAAGQALSFGAGLAVATAALHASGIALALAAGRWLRAGGMPLRLLGGLMALAGAGLAFG